MAGILKRKIKENEMNKIFKEIPQDFKELTNISFCNQQKLIPWERKNDPH